MLLLYSFEHGKCYSSLIAKDGSCKVIASEQLSITSALNGSFYSFASIDSLCDLPFLQNLLVKRREHQMKQGNTIKDPFSQFSFIKTATVVDSPFKGAGSEISLLGLVHSCYQDKKGNFMLSIIDDSYVMQSIHLMANLCFKPGTLVILTRLTKSPSCQLICDNNSLIFEVSDRRRLLSICFEYFNCRVPESLWNQYNYLNSISRLMQRCSEDVCNVMVRYSCWECPELSSFHVHCILNGKNIIVYHQNCMEKFIPSISVDSSLELSFSNASFSGNTIIMTEDTIFFYLTVPLCLDAIAKVPVERKVNGLFKLKHVSLISCDFSFEKVDLVNIVDIFCYNCKMPASRDSNYIYRCLQCDSFSQRLDLSFVPFSIEFSGFGWLKVMPFSGDSLFSFTAAEFKSRVSSIEISGNDLNAWFYGSLKKVEFEEVILYRSIEMDENDFLISSTDYFIAH